MRYRAGLGEQLSGSLGGVVASRSGGGITLRNRTVPVAGRSGLRQRSQAAMASVSQAWSSLTGDERAQWTGVATRWSTTNRLGDSIAQSGFAYFTALNVHRIACGTTIATAAPNVVAMRSLGRVVGFAASAANGISFVTAGADGISEILVRASAPLSPGRKCGNVAMSAIYRRVGPPQLTTGFVDVVPNVADFRFGSLVAGQFRFFEITCSRASSLCEKFRQLVQVTA